MRYQKKSRIKRWRLTWVRRETVVSLGHDPTVCVIWETSVTCLGKKLEISLSEAHNTVLGKLRYRDRILLFVSEVIHKRIHRLANRLSSDM